ncbi:hypothetical protein DITRI_Ditri06bG0029000 [Diplodiscus trichospermus]
MKTTPIKRESANRIEEIDSKNEVIQKIVEKKDREGSLREEEEMKLQGELNEDLELMEAKNVDEMNIENVEMMLEFQSSRLMNYKFPIISEEDLLDRFFSQQMQDIRMNIMEEIAKEIVNDDRIMNVYRANNIIMKDMEWKKVELEETGN